MAHPWICQNKLSDLLCSNGAMDVEGCESLHEALGFAIS